MKATEFLTESIILEDPTQVRKMILGQLDKIKDEEDLVNILKFTNKFSYKKDVANLAIAKDYKESISDIILTSIGNVDAPAIQIRAFIKKLATDGIVNEKLLLTPGAVHKIDQIIDKDFLPIFEKIKIDLFEKLSGKIGEMGDVGKGEYLLAILSPKINRRGAPGDLDITGTKVELKAGKNGRLGPAGTQTLAGRFGEFLGNCYKAKILDPKIKFDDPTLFNPKQNMEEFSNAFDNDPKKVAKAMEILLTMHLPGISVKDIVKKVVSGSTINGSVLKTELLAATYELYQKAKKFNGVIVLDETVTRYLYINTPESMRSVSSFLLAAFPSWTDKQGDCMKITIKTRLEPDVKMPIVTPGKKITPKHQEAIWNYATDLVNKAGLKDNTSESENRINGIYKIISDGLLKGNAITSIIKVVKNKYPELVKKKEQPITPATAPAAPKVSAPIKPVLPMTARDKAKAALAGTKKV